MQIAEQQAANPQSRARPVHGLKPSSQRSIGSDGRAAPSLPPPPTPPTDLAPSHVQQLGAVDLAELAAEGRAGDEAAPPLADEGGVDEARGVVGREAEEELLDELVQQSGRRRHADEKESASGVRRPVGIEGFVFSGEKKRSEIV